VVAPPGEDSSSTNPPPPSPSPSPPPVAALPGAAAATPGPLTSVAALPPPPNDSESPRAPATPLQGVAVLALQEVAALESTVPAGPPLGSPGAGAGAGGAAASPPPVAALSGSVGAAAAPPPPSGAASGPSTISGLVVTRLTGSIEALAALPELRPVTYRSGRTLKTGRTANEEAFLGQSRGSQRIGPSACKHCKAKKQGGPFTSCVVVAGLFGGSCCNCHYNSETGRCSLRQGKFSGP
jgi:hypothetical protein